MRLMFCDRCGQQGAEKKKYETYALVPVVRVVRVTMEPFGRTMDLCGDCRTALQPVLDDFLGVRPRASA